MTKIAIISRPEQGVLIDIGGCTTLNEATQHLTQTLQVSSQFWEDQPVDLNMGNLSLTPEEFSQVQAIFSERGVRPRKYFTQVESTKAALEFHQIKPSIDVPESLPVDSEGNPVTPPAPGEQPWTIGGEAAVKDPAAVRDAVTVKDPAAAKAPATIDATPGDNTSGESVTAESPTTEGGDAAPAGDATTSDTVPEKEKAPAPPAAPAAPHVLYLRQTLRSGQAVSHKGHLIIIGDVNPGAEVMAEGDITVWGALRGIAHAGIAGNNNAQIRALKFDPIQLRIAHAIARSPDRPRASMKSNGPETARIVDGIIRIASSAPE